MDYPFPAPRTGAREWIVIVLLLALAFVPLVRIAVRRRQPAGWRDAVIACVALVLTLVALAAYPFRREVAGPPTSGLILMLAGMIVSIELTWLFTSVLAMSSPTGPFRIGEVVVPYGVGLIVAFFLTPRWNGNRDSQYRTQCRNQLKQVLLGFHNFHDSYDHFPPAGRPDDHPPRSWRVDLLPYVDQEPLRRQYRDAEAWDAPINRPVAVTRVLVYRCPAWFFRELHEEPKLSSYFGVRGPNTLFSDDRGMKIRDVTDGTSNTIAVVEACGVPIVWTEPRDLDLSQQQIGVNLPGDRPGESRGVISSYHRGGGHIGLADGSVRMVSEDIDPKVLKALLSATGGEPQEEPRTK